MSDLPKNLTSIADASRRADGTDIPLGEQLRQAAARITALEADIARLRAKTACSIGFSVQEGRVTIYAASDEIMQLFLKYSDDCKAMMAAPAVERHSIDTPNNSL